MKKIAIMSGKGGVGKTTIAIGLGEICSKRGKTLLIDYDLSGPSTKIGCGVEGKIKKKEKGLEPVRVSDNFYLLSMAFMLKEGDCIAWRAPKKLNICKLFLESIDEYEFVIFDMPPGISYEHNFILDSKAILVTTSQNLALSDLDRMYDFLIKKKTKILGVIENMTGFNCENCGKTLYLFSRNGGKLFAKDKNIPFLGTIGLDRSISRNLDDGKLGESVEFLNTLEELVKSIL